MYAPRRQAGFTLVELMIVITIVAIVASAAAATLGHTLTNMGAIKVTQELQRIGRDAYWQTIRYRRAHVVYFSGMGDTLAAPGQVELIRGETNLCNQDWATLRTTGGACGEKDARCIAALTVSRNRYHGFGDVGPVLTRADGSPTAAFCYRPDGVVMWSNTLPGGGGFTNSANSVALAGGILFTVQVKEATTPIGVARTVLYPLGGPPRRVR